MGWGGSAGSTVPDDEIRIEVIPTTTPRGLLHQARPIGLATEETAQPLAGTADSVQDLGMMLIRRTTLSLLQHELQGAGLGKGESKLGLVIDKKSEIKRISQPRRNANDVALYLLSMPRTHQKIDMRQRDAFTTTQGHQSGSRHKEIRDAGLAAAGFGKSRTVITVSAGQAFQ